jgi:hypothetical protein
MIPLSLPLPHKGEGIIAGSFPLRVASGDSPRRGEGWERVKYQYYFETVNNP